MSKANEKSPMGERPEFSNLNSISNEEKLAKVLDLSLKIAIMEEFYKQRDQLVAELAESGIMNAELAGEQLEIVDNFAENTTSKHVYINRYSVKVASLEAEKQKRKNEKAAATRAANKAKREG